MAMKISEETTKSIVPVAAAVTGGFAAYTISEQHPELVGLGAAAVFAWWVSR